MPSDYENNTSWLRQKLGKYKPLNREQENILLTRIWHGDKVAKEKFFHHNLCLVVTIAERYRNRGLSLNDIIQEGTMALIKAIDKYPKGAPFRFSTHAWKWIRADIVRAINKTTLVRYWIHSLPDPLKRADKAIKDNPYGLVEELPIKAQDAEMVMRYLNRHNVEELNEEIAFLDCEEEAKEYSPEALVEMILNQELLIGLTSEELLVLKVRYVGRPGKRNNTGINTTSQLLNISAQKLKNIEHSAFNKVKTFLAESSALLPAI